MVLPPDHADRVCEAALTVQERIPDLWEIDESHPLMHTRIGLHTATVVGDGLVVLGGMTLNLKGVDSGKSHRVFDHMYILTGLQLLTHPARKATQGKPNDSPPQRSTGSVCRWAASRAISRWRRAASAVS